MVEIKAGLHAGSAAKSHAGAGRARYYHQHLFQVVTYLDYDGTRWKLKYAPVQDSADSEFPSSPPQEPIQGALEVDGMDGMMEWNGMDG